MWIVLNDSATFLLAFLMGALVGAGVVLLLVSWRLGSKPRKPRSYEEVRRSYGRQPDQT